MKGRYNFRRKGLTLIELLIIIVLICILGRASMLLALEMMASADAAKIISNLNSIRKATVLWYADNKHRVHNGFIDAPANSKDDKSANSPVLEAKNANDSLGILKYLGNGEITTLNANGRNEITEGTYATFSAGNNKQYNWYAGYKFKKEDEESVKEKLKGRAKTAGLEFTTSWPPGTINNDTGDNVVWLLILSDKRGTK